LLPQRTKAKNKATDLPEADGAKTLLKLMNKFDSAGGIECGDGTGAG
jgi:hypothetical protein